MFSYFEPNFIEKFHWESGFSNFGHVIIFAKRKFIFWRPFWNATFFKCFFLLIYDFFLGVYKYGVSFVPKFLQVFKNGWVQVDPPCAQTGVKSSLGIHDYPVICNANN